VKPLLNSAIKFVLCSFLIKLVSFSTLLLFILNYSNLALAGTGTGKYFRVQKAADGRWSFVTPEGKPFFSSAIEGVDPEGDTNFIDHKQEYKTNIINKYGSIESWTSVTLERIRQWGFNTLGTWSNVSNLEKQLPYTPIMNCSGSIKDEKPIPDFFSPEFKANAYAAAESVSRGRTEDSNLIGYFLDNEMHWGVDHRGIQHAFDVFYSRGAEEPGKVALVSLLKTKYSTIAQLNESWKTSFASFEDLASNKKLPIQTLNSEEIWSDRFDFLRLAARQYYSTCSQALRSYDPNHLLLGSRLISIDTFPEVLEAAAETQDVISINFYEFVPGVPELIKLFARKLVSPDGFLSHFYELSGKPLLISEFGFKAFSFETPSFFPLIFPTSPTQALRALKIKTYLGHISDAKYIIGYQYFKYMDEPSQGRFDGEDSNWGLVNINDEPYSEVVNVFQSFNRKIQSQAQLF